MRISLVIPTLWINPERAIIPCLKSLSNEYDELIIVDDTDLSLAQKINKGMRKSSGDYIIVSNDDILLQEGTLRGLCVDSVISPVVKGSIDKLFHGHMFSVPRWMYNRYGGFDEQYPGAYWIDSDYWMMLKHEGHEPVKHPYVRILHEHPANTLSAINEDTQLGRDRFIGKWGEESLNYVR